MEDFCSLGIMSRHLRRAVKREVGEGATEDRGDTEVGNDQGIHARLHRLTRRPDERLQLSVGCERIERNFTLAKPALRAKCLRDIYDVISKIQMQSGVSGYQRSQYEIIQPAVDYIELNYSNTIG